MVLGLSSTNFILVYSSLFEERTDRIWHISYNQVFLVYFAREKSKLQEEIAARRQRKLLMRHTRKKYLEEAAVREAELLQELDRCFLLDD